MASPKSDSFNAMTKFYYTLFNLLALTLIIYTGVDAFYRIVRAQLTQFNVEKIVTDGIPDQKEHRNPPSSHYRVIGERHLLGSLEKAPEPPKAPQIETLEPTSLKVALLGTVAGDQSSSVAVIEETDKRKQGLFKVGDSVKNAIVKVILRGKVVLRVGEKDEILTMEDSSAKKAMTGRGGRTPSPSVPLPEPSSEPEEATIALSRAEVEASLKDVNALLSQVRIRPHFRDGKADGLSIQQIQKDSIFSRLGLINGDIVQGVDDQMIQSPDDIISVYSRLESGSEVSLKINRRGKQKTINYVFE